MQQRWQRPDDAAFFASDVVAPRQHLPRVMPAPVASALTPRLLRRSVVALWPIPPVHAQCAAKHAARIGRHVGAVEAVLGDTVSESGYAEAARHPEVHVVVLAPAQRFVEATQFEQAIAAIRDRAVHGDEVPAQQLEVGVPPRRLVAAIDHMPGGIDVHVAAVDEPARGIAAEACARTFDGVASQPVVWITNVVSR